MKARASELEFREMAMRMLDAGIVAMIVFHSADRTIVEVRSNVG